MDGCVTIQVNSGHAIYCFLNPLSSGGDFCQLNHSVKFVHICLELNNLIKMTINNPSRKSVVLESSAKPRPGQPKLGLADDSRTIDSGCKVAQSARG